MDAVALAAEAAAAPPPPLPVKAEDVEAGQAPEAPKEAEAAAPAPPAAAEAAAPTTAPAPAAAAAPPPPKEEEPQPEPAQAAEEVKAEEVKAEEEPAPAAEPKAEEPAPAPAAEASDAAVVARLRELLAEADLAATSEKQLRRRLEGEFGVDLSGRKALLRAEIEAYLQADADAGGEAPADEAEEAEEAEGEGDDDEAGGGAPSRKRGRGPGAFGSRLSEAMQAFLGESRCPRTQVVKRLWVYIKEHKLQDPKNGRRILLDDKLKTIFPGKSVNMFSMQKLLSKHCFTDDVTGGTSSEEDDDDGGSDEEGSGDDGAPAAKRARRPAAAKAAAKKKPAAARKRAARDLDAPAKPNGFTKPVKLSPELAAWMGAPAASRPAITKHLWAYVKERGLQDEANKQFVLADDALKALTGEARFKAFSFNKLIKDHILGYADADAE